jgi:hypothetical protein
MKYLENYNKFFKKYYTYVEIFRIKKVSAKLEIID